MESSSTAAAIDVDAENLSQMNWDFGDVSLDPAELLEGYQPTSMDDLSFLSPTMHFDEPSPVAGPNQETARTTSARSRRIRPAEWEMHRHFIETQYPLMTLQKLRSLMESQHGFVARYIRPWKYDGYSILLTRTNSEQQWKRKLGEWNFAKNLRPPLTRFIKKRTLSRLLQDNKSTRFSFHGQPIPMEKVSRHIQEGHIPSSPTGSTFLASE